MAGFQALDKRLSMDEQALHDVLWQGSKADIAKLRANIQRDLRALDMFLGAGGKLRRMGGALDKAWGDSGAGESLLVGNKLEFVESIFSNNTSILR